jgi:hypothetical protein
MAADTEWRSWRDFGGFPHAPWAQAPPALQMLQGKPELTLEALPGVRFVLPNRQLIPVSWKYGRTRFKLPLNRAPFKKFYLLVVPYIDNHESFVRVARLSVRSANGGVWSHDLVMPGDLDWFVSQKQLGPLWSTGRPDRANRLGLLPLLTPAQGDWPEGKPPQFPQPDLWTRTLAVDCGSSVMNVIELDLGQPEPVDSLIFEALGTEPAFGIVAISADQGVAP